jgi:hypothetical protein
VLRRFGRHIIKGSKKRQREKLKDRRFLAFFSSRPDTIPWQQKTLLLFILIVLMSEKQRTASMESEQTALVAAIPRQLLDVILKNASEPKAWSDLLPVWITALAWTNPDCRCVLWHYRVKNQKEQNKLLAEICKTVQLFGYLPGFKLVRTTLDSLMYSNVATMATKQVIFLPYQTERYDGGIQFHYSFFHPKSPIVRDLFPLMGVEADYTWIVHPGDRLEKHQKESENVK